MIYHGDLFPLLASGFLIYGGLYSLLGVFQPGFRMQLRRRSDLGREMTAGEQLIVAVIALGFGGFCLVSALR